MNMPFLESISYTVHLLLACILFFDNGRFPVLTYLKATCKSQSRYCVTKPYQKQTPMAFLVAFQVLIDVAHPQGAPGFLSQGWHPGALWGYYWLWGAGDKKAEENTKCLMCCWAYGGEFIGYLSRSFQKEREVDHQHNMLKDLTQAFLR